MSITKYEDIEDIKELMLLFPIFKRRLMQYAFKSTLASSLFIIFISIILSVLGLFLGYAFEKNVAVFFIKSPLLIIANTLPVTLLMLAVYYITSRIWISYWFGGGLVFLLQLINKYKIALREEPLSLSDLTLGGEAAGIVNITELPISKYIILLIVLFIFAGAFIAFYIKQPLIIARKRLIFAAGCIIAAQSFYYTFYRNTEIFDSMPVEGTIYNLCDVYRSRGFVYSFLATAKSAKVSKPENYSKNEIKTFFNNSIKTKADSNANKPHIIAIMGEAFFDIDRIKGIEFNDGLHPLKNFNKIKEDSYGGRIVTCVFGGGTSNAEFSFLTGNNTSFLPPGSTAYKSYIKNKKYTLAYFLKKIGYETTAFHPGYSWFYNRINVYRYFGFDRIIFRKDLEDGTFTTRRGYVTDQSVMEYILKDLKRHISEKPANPYFNFTVTIENHGPYREAYAQKILKRLSSMDDGIYESMNGYIFGLRLADQALGYLIEQLEKINEPVVVIYFGDHLPSFGENYKGYSEYDFKIGFKDGIEGFLNTYCTPFFIWSNEEAKKITNHKNMADIKTFEENIISPNFLAVELLNYVGFEDNSYFTYLSSLREVLPVITHAYFNENGIFTDRLSDESTKLVEEYKKIQYYMMFDYMPGN